MNPPSAAGEEKGAAGGGSQACRGAEGGGDPRSPAADLEEPALAGPKEESLEEKLKSLTFRKQVSYSFPHNPSGNELIYR
uniref:Uncharacterized protein n=1 Tax=Sphaerodactylus townsendi TaxID=933632 RepID=A0ACB8FM97_9SAUR